MDFSYALKAIKRGKRLSRHGWNGKGMYLYMVRPTDDSWHPYIVMMTANEKLVPWLASQTDLMGEDWFIMEVE